jgi:hypothetical protein
MSRLQRVLAAALAIAALVCAFVVIEITLPAPAHASGTQVSMLLDDDELIYVSPQHMMNTLHTLHQLGVDVVKVSLVWQLIAPDQASTQRPAFNATDPAAYPSGAWSRWDALVEAAHQLGMKVYFLLIGPSPLWAIPKGQPTNQGPSLGWAPSPGEYQQFAMAAGKRYSGAYTDPLNGQTIPRVDYWGVWNEPNERAWLNPDFGNLPHHRRALLQPQIYRNLVDAGWRALSATGHAGDTVMIGETANQGIMAPIPFIRALYCVGNNLRPLRGVAASSFGCPRSGRRSRFAAQHPGLFRAAVAHHPYAFPYQGPPNRPFPDPTFVTLYNVPSFERLLNGIFATYGKHPSGGVPLYLTEWGYKTNPPNPYVNTTPAQQAAYLNEGEYMTRTEPYVRGLTQFLLVDSPPKPHTRPGSALYWSTFQTGLEYINDAPKPAFAAFQLPIWLPHATHGPNVTVWGQLRPADHTTAQNGVIQFLPSGSSTWRDLAQVQTSDPEGVVNTHVSIPSAGAVRLGWVATDGSTLYSRTVQVG